MIDAALKLAAQGFAVFPCQPKSKIPATRNGFYDASTNPATIKRWLASSQDYNIAVRTGMASHCWVFDCDQTASLEKLVSESGPLPLTRQSQGNRGRHFWFRTDVPVFCGNSRIAPGLDVKGDGGYVVAPPSVHPDGPVYRWLNDAPLASAPGWLLKLARQRPKPQAITKLGHNGLPVTAGRYGQTALDLKELASTPNGARNEQLNKKAFNLFQLVAGGELGANEVQAALIAACERNGLIAEDGRNAVLNTIRSGARAGMQYPRTRNGRCR